MHRRQEQTVSRPLDRQLTTWNVDMARAHWRDSARRVRRTWDEWKDAADGERDRAHAHYVEALADEELAAAWFEHQSRLAGRP